VLSQRTRYALRALVHLAGAEGRRPLSTTEMADAVSAPVKYLEATLIQLRRHGLLRSVRGNKGGYILARAADAITFAEVARCLDDGLELAPCVGARPSPCPCCPESGACAARPALAAAQAVLDETLTAWTLDRARRHGGAPAMAAG
jgi:Rrf2 family protein